MNGVINIRKEAGFTSFDVVACLRRILQEKKIGHTGTLDPDAVGVLPVCVGNATRAVELFTAHDKEYRCTLRLGVETDTYDSSGTVTARGREDFDEAAVRGVLPEFIGTISQIPPMYAAIRVNGQHLYELARKGETVERMPRSVRVDEIELMESAPPYFTLRVVCGKGTYIRSLCHDIGIRLGSFGCMERLTRTRVGAFSIEDAYSLDQVQKLAECGDTSFLQSVDGLLALPRLRVKADREVLLRNGNKLEADCFEAAPEDPERGARFLVYDAHGVFCGIYESTETEQGLYKPYKMFL